MNMPSTKPHPRARARELYNQFGPRVDDVLASRLRKARRRALDAGAGPARWVRRMVPASAFTVAIVAAMLIWQPLQHMASAPTMTSTTQSVSMASILPPDAGQTDPTLYQDMGFYAWLAQQPDTQAQTRN